MAKTTKKPEKPPKRKHRRVNPAVKAAATEAAATAAETAAVAAETQSPEDKAIADVAQIEADEARADLAAAEANANRGYSDDADPHSQPGGAGTKQPTKMPGEVDAFKQVLRMMDAAPESQLDSIVDYCSQRDLKNLPQLDEDLWDMGITQVNKRRRVINYWARSMALPVDPNLASHYRSLEPPVAEGAALPADKRAGLRRFYVEEDMAGVPKVRIAKPGESAMSLQEASTVVRELRGQAGKSEEQVVIFSDTLGKHIPNSASDWVKKNMAAAWATAREFDRSAMQNAEPPDPIDTMIEQMTKIEAIKGIMHPGAAGAEGGPKGDLLQMVEAMSKLDEMRKGGANQQQMPAWMTDPVLLISTMKSLSPEKGPDPVVEEMKTRLASQDAKITQMQEAATQRQFDELKAQNERLATAITSLQNRPAPGEPTALSLMKDGISVLEKEAKGIRTDLKDLGKDVILTAGQGGDPTVAAVKQAVGKANNLEALTDRLVALTTE
jgi:hypothetical protein